MLLCFQTLIPAGYLIPISQQTPVADKEVQSSGRESSKASTPTYNIYQTPTAGEYVRNVKKHMKMCCQDNLEIIISAVLSRLQTLHCPGGNAHQHPSSQTCRLPSHRPAGPPPPQPQSRHPQLHPAEPGPHFRLQPRERLRCPPVSRLWKPTATAAERHGVHQTHVPCSCTAACSHTTGGPDQCTTGNRRGRPIGWI